MMRKKDRQRLAVRYRAVLVVLIAVGCGLHFFGSGQAARIGALIATVGVIGASIRLMRLQ